MKFLKKLRLPLLVTGHATGLFLPLIVHHFLDHCAGFTIEIAETGIFRCNFGHINLGGRRHHMRPPFHLVRLVEVDVDFLARWGRGRLQGPGRFVDDDRVREIALKATT